MPSDLIEKQMAVSAANYGKVRFRPEKLVRRLVQATVSEALVRWCDSSRWPWKIGQRFCTDHGSVGFAVTPFSMSEGYIQEPDGSVIVPLVPLRRALLVEQAPPTACIVSPEVARRWRTIRLLINDGCAMSNCGAELFEMMEAVALAQARGARRVLVGGLGLGILARMLVEVGMDVTVVEASPAVIKLNQQRRDDSLRDAVISYGRIEEFLATQPLDCFDAFLLDSWSGTGERVWQQCVVPQRALIRARTSAKKPPLVWCWQEDTMLAQLADACSSWAMIEDAAKIPASLPATRAFVRGRDVTPAEVIADPAVILPAIRAFLDPALVGTESWFRRWGRDGWGTGTEVGYHNENGEM